VIGAYVVGWHLGQTSQAAFVSGLLLGLGLITPIGPQNVFVIGQGIAVGVRRALWAAVAAALCDSLLILVGAAGVSGVLVAVPAARTVLLVAGALFLGYLGVKGLRSKGSRLDDPPRVGTRHVIGRTVSVSLLNPHAILDTVGVIGAAVVAQPARSRWVFAAGTVSASWLWFVVLAVGAGQLRRYLTGRATVWFDRFSGAVLLVFAVSFVVELVKSRLTGPGQ
jgi:L-lysine exporter family protein LysE/ArgO